MSYNPENSYFQVQSGSAGISGTTLKMAGYAGIITPKSTGKVLIIISGDVENTVSVNGAGIELLYGTGTAPVNGAAVTGTLVGQLISFDRFTGSSKFSPFSVQGIVVNLTVGVTYWADLAIKENTTGTGSVITNNGSISLIELESNTSTYQASPTNPTGSSSIQFIMMGLAGSITPKSSGRILAIISGNFQSTSATGGVEIEIKYGTGTAPANGALGVANGTILGRINHIDNSIGPAGDRLSFSVQGIVSGLVVGTTYWVDLAQQIVNTASTSNLTNISLTILEL